MPDNKFYRQLQFQLNRSFKKTNWGKCKIFIKIISKFILDKNVTIRNELLLFFKMPI